jgi:hypothetical protein
MKSLEENNAFAWTPIVRKLFTVAVQSLIWCSLLSRVGEREVGGPGNTNTRDEWLLLVSYNVSSEGLRANSRFGIEWGPPESSGSEPQAKGQSWP